MAIRKLGWAFFKRDDVSRKRVVQSLPRIFEWMWALLPVRPIYDEGNLFSGAVGEIFNICVSACPSVFDDDKVVELAVRAWIGIDNADDEDCYTARALLACLGIYAQEPYGGFCRIEKALDACDITATDLVDQIVARLKWEIRQTSSMNVMKVLNISEMAARLVPLRGSIRFAMLEPAVGAFFVTVLKALLDNKPSSNDSQAIRSVLHVLYGCLRSQTVEYAIYTVREGIFALLPKIASLDSGLRDPSELDCSSLASEIIKQLLPCVACDYEASAVCRKEVENIHKSDYQLKIHLAMCPKSFMDTWVSLGAAILEIEALLRLFERGFGIEDGVCANRDCRRSSFRKDFKKCEGCHFALYCSRSCQKSDWSSHRTCCKTMNDESSTSYRCSSNKFHFYCLFFCISPAGVFCDTFNRLLRRENALHINRHWDSIVRLAKKKQIPLQDIAVRTTFHKFPFIVEVFDYHELLKDDKDQPQLAMVANEKLRQSVEDQHEWMVVVLNTMQSEYPCMIRVSDKWTRAVSKPPPKGKDRERTLFVDEDGNALICERVDALYAVTRLAKKYAVEMGETVWNSAAIRQATYDVIDDFESELFPDSDSDSYE
ncbi:hypothetical protein SCHPADRAFT_908346 [Schizopora paradoxa]|uniref:MYND-type domain-containing protein n=1 Tax=Schizopora paradoxa TaxID=27342 RepID=A0A0H2RAA7_9AGAM|nr:hypothetical protein SCHPADRAFT_908346 [Schizopora paradoxa]